jgi:hypothetical protein
MYVDSSFHFKHNVKAQPTAQTEWKISPSKLNLRYAPADSGRLWSDAKLVEFVGKVFLLSSMNLTFAVF